MSDTITVRFGEREVVLESRFNRQIFIADVQGFWLRMKILASGHADADAVNANGRYGVTWHASPQAAVDALYGTILAHRDELNRLIGGGK